MKKAIIIGGTSGIGRALAEKLVRENWTVGITGRRENLLNEIKAKSENQILTLKHDITELESSDEKMDRLFNQLGTVDLVIVSSGYAEINRKLIWDIQKKVVETNVVGISKMYQYLFLKLKSQGHGHLVGISSIASIRGNRHCPSYGAAKAYQANYLESLRCMSKKKNMGIKVTDVQPGFVDTAMAKGPGMFWVAPVEKAANQIYSGVMKGKRKIYVTKRWRLIAWVLNLAPGWVLEKL